MSLKLSLNNNIVIEPMSRSLSNGCFGDSFYLKNYEIKSSAFVNKKQNCMVIWVMATKTHT